MQVDRRRRLYHKNPRTPSPLAFFNPKVFFSAQDGALVNKYLNNSIEMIEAGSTQPHVEPPLPFTVANQQPEEREALKGPLWSL